MRTYMIDESLKAPIYEQLYRAIRADILSGSLSKDTKLPSKRNLAKNLGISIITVENAYAQLIAEGYVYALEKRGYFVSELEADAFFHVKSHESLAQIEASAPTKTAVPTNNAKQYHESADYFADFTSNAINPDNFPFTIWARIMREVIADRKEDLLTPAPVGGVRELREAIVSYLYDFRGMKVDESQIIVGAGTEYLMGLLIQLLGKEKRYGVEDPGYRKISQILTNNDISFAPIPVDKQGISLSLLKKEQVEIMHLSPSHHFPTGVITPIAKRRALLSWAVEEDGRYLIEDDYDSEFRLLGKPVPTLQSIDQKEKVIYLNTFSKSLASTIRISYMVLPPHLRDLFYEKLGFYSCTVSTFEQYTLARFLTDGYFEKHINRMRNYYRKQRNYLLECIKKSPLENRVTILEEDSGLHFLMQVHTAMSDTELTARAKNVGIRISCLSDYSASRENTQEPVLVINYSGVKPELMQEAVEKLAACL